MTHLSAFLTELSFRYAPSSTILVLFKIFPPMMKGNFLYTKLGKRIIIERKRRKLSQEQLAFACSIDRTYLARIEEGKANPSVKILHKISRKLHVKISILLRGL